jgi:hypothetical protein
MAKYALETELASYLQKDLDTASATQALTLATGEFVRRARRRWAATAASYLTTATYSTSLALPFRSVTAITALKINGVATAVDYTLRHDTVYRELGFGDPYTWPPQEITVELTYGETTIPDDVKLGVLGCGGEIYDNPTGIASETIDDDRIQYSGTPIAPGRDWREVADYYRGLLVA